MLWLFRCGSRQVCRPIETSGPSPRPPMTAIAAIRQMHAGKRPFGSSQHLGSCYQCVTQSAGVLETPELRCEGIALHATATEGSKLIVRAITSLGKSLGMTTTAEGVETIEQLKQVKAEGCNEAQGFLFSRPVPATELAATILMLRSGLKRGGWSSAIAS